MDQYVGQKLKSIVKLITTVAYIGWIILGVFAMIAVPGFVGFIIGLFFAGYGCLMTWIGGLILYAFGETTDRIVNIDERLSSANRTNVQVEENQKETLKESESTNGNENMTRIRVEEPTWECAACGTMNPGVMSRCRVCSRVKLIY